MKLKTTKYKTFLIVIVRGVVVHVIYMAPLLENTFRITPRWLRYKQIVLTVNRGKENGIERYLQCNTIQTASGAAVIG